MKRRDKCEKRKCSYCTKSTYPLGRQKMKEQKEESSVLAATSTYFVRESGEEGSIFAKLSNFSENGAGSKRNCTRENEAKVLLTDRTCFPLNLLRCPDTIFSWYVVSGHIRFVSWSLRGKNISQKSPVFLLPICLPCHHSSYYDNYWINMKYKCVIRDWDNSLCTLLWINIQQAGTNCVFRHFPRLGVGGGLLWKVH